MIFLADKITHISTQFNLRV